MTIRRIALGVRYDGSHYHGWQAQQNLATVQFQVEKAVGRVADHVVSVTCAGRTDAGVHALGQVIHFNTEAERALDSWVLGANSNLPPDISVMWAHEVPIEFHARYSATARRYRYLIYNNPIRPTVMRLAVGWYYKLLDAKKMQQAAQYLVGEFDFSAFRGRDCQARSPVRRITEVSVIRHGDMIVVDIEANAFLHHMVRNIVGTLIAIGCGDRPVGWIDEVLQSRDRCQGGITFSPTGLYLIAVTYPMEFGLPKTPPAPIMQHTI